MFEVNAVVVTLIQGEEPYQQSHAKVCGTLSEFIVSLLEEGLLNGSEEEMWHVGKQGVEISWMEYDGFNIPMGFSKQSLRIFVNGKEISTHYSKVCDQVNADLGL